MQRWLTILLGALAVGLALVVAYKSVGDHAPSGREALSDAQAVAVAIPYVPPTDGGDDGTSHHGDFLSDLGGPVAGDPRNPEVGPGWGLPDGRVPPPLPEGTPKHVHLGVVLVSFAGAQ